MGKLAAAVFCLVFAIPFGGVGVFASWSIVTTLADAVRARSWVPVQATVERTELRESEGSEGDSTFRAVGLYRYEFEGAPYSGRRLGLSRQGGSDNIDDWHAAVVARLDEARAAGRTVTVWVNPEEPWVSVYDRSVRWSEILFMVPFSLAFGGVGVGALAALVSILRGGQGGPSNVSGAGWLWIFAFFWNALSFPIAILVVQDVMKTGEWGALFVLLFPLVGIGVIWAAAAASWKAFVERRRAADPARQAAPRAATASFAAQAERAMFEPGGRMPGFRPSAAPVEIPEALASVEERLDTLAIRYSRRRHLGAALVLLAVGTVFTAVGVGMAASGELLVGLAVALGPGAAVDLYGVSLLVRSLEVTVKGRALQVAKAGLFGRRSWQARGEDIESLRTSVMYSVNEVPYFAIHAQPRSGERIPLGDGIKGEALAAAIARRVAAALGLDASRVIAEASPGRPGAPPGRAAAGHNG